MWKCQKANYFTVKVILMIKLPLYFKVIIQQQFFHFCSCKSFEPLMLPQQQSIAEFLILRSFSCLMQHSLGQHSASHQTCSVLPTPFHSPKEHPAIFPVPAMALDLPKTTEIKNCMLLKSCRNQSPSKVNGIFFFF